MTHICIKTKKNHSSHQLFFFFVCPVFPTKKYDKSVRDTRTLSHLDSSSFSTILAVLLEIESSLLKG
jgi:hypothetical protein